MPWRRASTRTRSYASERGCLSSRPGGVGRDGLGVEELAPLLAAELEVEVFARADPANGECDPRRKAVRSPRVDEESRAIRQSSRDIAVSPAFAVVLANDHVADLAAAAAAVHLVVNRPR